MMRESQASILETHPVTVTTGPFSWLRLTDTVKPRPAPAFGGRDTRATMWELLASGETAFADSPP